MADLEEVRDVRNSLAYKIVFLSKIFEKVTFDCVVYILPVKTYRYDLLEKYCESGVLSRAQADLYKSKYAKLHDAMVYSFCVYKCLLTDFQPTLKKNVLLKYWFLL